MPEKRNRDKNRKEPTISIVRDLILNDPSGTTSWPGRPKDNDGSRRRGTFFGQGFLVHQGTSILAAVRVRFTAHRVCFDNLSENIIELPTSEKQRLFVEAQPGDRSFNALSN